MPKKLSDRQWRQLTSAVEDQGRRYGAARGSWVIGAGTGDEATIEHIVTGIEDGDPEVLDALPELQMGEWADDPTENDIISEAAYTAGIELDPDELEPEEADELQQAFQAAWYEGRDAEIYRDARGALGSKKFRELTAHK